MYSSREIITCMLSLLIKRVTVMPNSAQSSLGSKCKHNPNEVKIAFQDIGRVNGQNSGCLQQTSSDDASQVRSQSNQINEVS